MNRPYTIQFESLSLGKHEFFFEVDHSIFEESNIKELLDTQINAKVYLTKTDNMMDLNVHFKGQLTLPCDRCTGIMKIPVDEEARLVIKYRQEDHEDLEDLMILDDRDHEIKLFDFFYENINLMLPQRNVHIESDCDPEVIKMLNTTWELESEIKSDPRWEKLKNL